MATAVVTGEHRQKQTALFLIACGCAGAAPHWLEAGRNLLPAITLSLLLGGYGLFTVLHSRKKFFNDANESIYSPTQEAEWPLVDVLVAARDEEAVVRRLVDRLQVINYPKSKISFWIIDDGSVDKTPQLLKDLQSQFPCLNVVNRSRSAGGGKSGALNAALSQLSGEWLLILDADAQLQPDSLRRLIVHAKQGRWSAVQLRKAVVNSNQNWLTRFQAMEMAMDAVIQEGRLEVGGVVELRGNGQLLDRRIVQDCGGFNEDTVTDDLDLSFRFLIAGALVGILWDPPVQEEAVETWQALWRQRQRWAEGGLQRFFDYWPFLISDRLSFIQRHDLVSFFLLQYALPVVSFADLLATILTGTMPTYWPLSIIAFSVSGLAFWRGCNCTVEGPVLPSAKPFTLLMAIIYLGHWFVVIPWVTIRMALFPKKLVWAKTSHLGK